MEETFTEQVFNTLNGYYISDYNVPGVKNAFAAGQPCLRLYCDAMNAYQRLCSRLGVGEEDGDLEIMVNAFADISKILCLKMYYYGALFGEKEAAE